MARSPHRLLSEKKSTSSMLFDKSSTRPGLSGEAGSRASSFLRAEKTTSLREGGGGLGTADGAGSKPHMFGRLSKNDATKLAREGAKGSAGDAVGGALESSVASGEISDQAGATSRSAATATSLAAGRESARLAKKGIAANQDLMGSALDEFNKTAPSKKSIGEKRTKLGKKAEKARYKSWKKAGKLEGGGKKGMSRFGKGAKSAADGAGSAAAAGKSGGAASGKAASKIAFRRKSATRAVRVNFASVRGAFAKAGTAIGSAVASIVTAVSTGIAAVASSAPLMALVAIFVGLAVASTIGTSIIGGAAYTYMNKSNGGEQLARAAIAECEKYQTASVEKRIKMVADYHTNAGYESGHWCSMFVYWCWTRCGFEKSIGTPPGLGWANSWIYWGYHDKSAGKVIEYEPGYIAKQGDIIVDGDPYVLGGEEHSVHVGIVVTDGKYGDFDIVDGNPVVSRYHVSGSFVTWRYVFRANFPNSAGTALGEGVNFNVSERAFVREWAPRIDAYIARVQGTHAPLYGHGECFARSAYRGKMDPRWLPVISFFESNCGLAAWGTYNCYGWGVTDSGATSVAYANGYDSMIAFILENASGRGNGWAGSKVLSEYTSIEELDDEYCSSSAGRVALIKAHMMSI